MSSKSINRVFHGEGLLLGVAHFPGISQPQYIIVAFFRACQEYNEKQHNPCSSRTRCGSDNQAKQPVTKYTHFYKGWRYFILALKSGCNFCPTVERQYFCYCLYNPKISVTLTSQHPLPQRYPLFPPYLLT